MLRLLAYKRCTDLWNSAEQPVEFGLNRALPVLWQPNTCFIIACSQSLGMFPSISFCICTSVHHELHCSCELHTLMLWWVLLGITWMLALGGISKVLQLWGAERA